MDRLVVEPNFFIVGAPKSGTTNISYYLIQHTQVFMPENLEPYYFARLDIPQNYEREIISNEKKYLLLKNMQKDIDRMNVLITDISRYTLTQVEIDEELFYSFDVIEFLKDFLEVLLGSF